jgi:hypothetical protein
MPVKKKVDVVQSGTSLSGILSGVWGFVAWLTGVIVSLAVGFGLVNNVLTVPYIPLMVTEIAGLVVIILSFLGITLAIIDKLGK